MKSAVITGINGQDGYYLTKLLISRGYTVFGISKDNTNFHNIPGVQIITVDMCNREELIYALSQTKPELIFNLASHSFVPTSWDNPKEIMNINGFAVVNLLDYLRENKECRLFQSSSAEMFGNPLVSPQNENTPFNPRNPYGASKVYAHSMVKMYREKYGVFAASGILYNHESIKRGLSFVTQKVVQAARYFGGLREDIAINESGESVIDNDGKLHIGNIHSLRDWGNPKDYVYAMYLLLMADQPDDYVIATGKLHSVKDLVQFAFNEVGISKWQEYVVIDPKYYREDKGNSLVGDIQKIKRNLNWEPTISFEQTIINMVRNIE